MSTTFAGFLGALIGAGASLLGLLIQQYYQMKRERMKIAADLGLSDYHSSIELAKLSNRLCTVAPVSAYVMYHARLLDEISKGKPDRARIETISKEFEELLEAFPKPKEYCQEGE